MNKWLIAIVLTLALLSSHLHAAEPVTLGKADAENLGWTFNNGQEFPGAVGSLTVDATLQHDGAPSLKLAGDFNKGGNYVAAGFETDLDIQSLSLWVRNNDADMLVIRIVDAGGQCHQINLKSQATAEWQQIIFPLADFFAKRGTPDAVGSVAKYESWGGANDGKWHGPAKGLHILLGSKDNEKVHTIWLSQVCVVPGIPAAAVEAGIKTLVPLDMVEEGETTWGFSLGQEFKGAKGSLTVVKDDPEKGSACLKLSGDFTAGGAYVETLKDLKSLDLGDLVAIHLKYKTDNAALIGVRLVDGTGQCHQKARTPLQADGQWHELILKTWDVTGGEHWGGANDAKWHGPAGLVSINVSNRSDPKNQTPVLFLADANAEILQPAVAGVPSFQCGFEESDQLPAGWVAAGSVSIDAHEAFKGKHALLLQRTLEAFDHPSSVKSAAFKITPGQWKIDLACKADLQSPDSSYDGTVQLELLDDTGKAISQLPLAELFGQHNWQALSKRVEVPTGVAAACFTVELHKATGRFWLDELSAAYLSAAPRKDNRITKIVFATAQMGNILFAEDKRTVAITVEATKPLPEAQLQMSYVLRDYWGAEQNQPATIALTRGPKARANFTYTATIDLSSLPLAIGKYYELVAQIPRENDLPFSNYTSFAILPQAITKQYKPEEIPFTSRNWDNRIGDYFTLSDRLGIRICGVWGGWSSNPPYTPTAPAIEMCAKLGMGVLTGCPTHEIEEHSPGYEKYDETALRQGVRNWIAKYGKVRPLIIDLGNEPHGTGPRIQDDVKGYRIVYDEVKMIDPAITVLGTSCGPQEEFFQAGFGDCCDAYDFHIYEDYHNVTRTIERYHQLFKQYGHEKPIWSTELGLNSQGMTRKAIADELIKKFTVFFAAGGANVSWFDIMYPDPEAKHFDSSGDSMNVFDCRYARYAPKLDALAYYNMVNGICIKKFVAQKEYPGGINDFLFRDRDGRCLQILWTDKGRTDAAIPLAGVDAVQMIGIDGVRTDLTPAGGNVTVSVSEDPILLIYQGGAGVLPDELATPAASISVLPASLIKGGSVPLTVAVNGIATADVSLNAPPFWNVTRADAGKDAAGASLVTFTITAPDSTAAREGNLAVQLKDAKGNTTGVLAASVAVAGRLSVEVFPEPPSGAKPPAVKLVVKNNSAEAQNISWNLALENEMTMKNGEFTAPSATTAYFADAADGTATIAANAAATFTVGLSGVDRQTIYRVKAAVNDASGRTIERERFVAGFVGVPKATGPIKLDATMSEPDWQKCSVETIDEARQYRVIDPRDNVKWKGPADLSGKVRFLWDDQYLYVGINVTDDIFCNTKVDDMIWAGDGLQMLIDPARAEAEKPGKYDYAMALSQKGPQAWCYLSASPAAPTGEAKDIIVATKRATDGTGAIDYELAIPWSRVAPFKPGVGRNIGLCVALNEDDGTGRHGFMGWFGDVQSKVTDYGGDLVLQP